MATIRRKRKGWQVLIRKKFAKQIIKTFVLCLFCVLFCCDVDRDCFTIIQKTVSNGQFLFIGTFEDNQNTSDEDPTIGFADVNLEVSQDVYNAYELGDQYCYQ